MVRRFPIRVQHLGCKTCGTLFLSVRSLLVQPREDAGPLKVVLVIGTDLGMYEYTFYHGARHFAGLTHAHPESYLAKNLESNELQFRYQAQWRDAMTIYSPVSMDILGRWGENISV